MACIFIYFYKQEYRFSGLLYIHFLNYVMLLNGISANGLRLNEKQIYIIIMYVFKKS